MFKDDRFISILSGIVIMFAIGVLVQRGDSVTGLFGVAQSDLEAGQTVAEGGRVLNDDASSVRAGQLVRIDVLGNDVGLADGDVETLTIVAQPKCGRGFVQQGSLQYLASIDCAGQQEIKYSVAGFTATATVDVSAVVQPPAPEVSDAAPVTDDTTRGTVSAGEDGAETADVPDRTGTLAAASIEPDAVAPTPEFVPALAANRPSAPVSVPSSPTPGGDVAAAPEIATEGVGLDLQIDTAPDAVETSSDPARAPGQELALAAPAEAPAPLSVPAPRPRVADRAPAPAIVADTVSEPATLSVPPSAPELTALGSDDSPEDLLSGIPRSVARPSLDDIGISSGATLALAQIDQQAPTTDIVISRPTDTLPARGADAPALAVEEPESSVTSGLDDLLAALDTFGTRTARTTRQLPQALPSPSLAAPPTAPTALTAPAQPADEPVGDAGGDAAREEQPAEVAALAPQTAPCATPASVDMSIFQGARTKVKVSSPCHANSAAELRYGGLSLGLAIDENGEGSLEVLGFEQSSPAVMVFDNGETATFTLMFADSHRVTRVAVLWDMDVDLELHALEFGSQIDGLGHVRPGNPRDFEMVRTEGGGYLARYEPVNGVGQSARIYSHWHRRGGQAGVVNLLIDFASRHRTPSDETCGTGRLAQPIFTVLRGNRGALERPLIRRLLSVECGEVAGTAGKLISGAVNDLIVTRR